MIDIERLPKAGLLRLTSLLEDLRKTHARVTLGSHLKTISEVAESCGLFISNRQIGLIRRVVSRKTHTRGIMIRFFYRTSIDENLPTFLSNLIPQLSKENKVDLTFWTTPLAWFEDRSAHLFAFNVVFDGYSDYFQNETRKFLRDNFPHYAKKENIGIEPIQFVLLHKDDNIDHLHLERARGAEYVYLLSSISNNKMDTLVELAKSKRRSIWANQTFWVGDIIGGI